MSHQLHQAASQHYSAALLSSSEESVWWTWSKNMQNLVSDSLQHCLWWEVRACCLQSKEPFTKSSFYKFTDVVVIFVIHIIFIRTSQFFNFIYFRGVGSVECRREPSTVCGAGCGEEEGEEVCHDKQVVSVRQVPQENCDLQPVKTCRYVRYSLLYRQVQYI